MNERCFENIMKDQITLNKRQLGNIRDRPHINVRLHWLTHNSQYLPNRINNQEEDIRNH